MRRIEPTTAFRRDFRRVEATPRDRDIQTTLSPLLELLAADEPLPRRHRDHALTGNWVDHRECHVKPDLLLIYRKPDTETLQLVRLGSHSELLGR